MHRTNLYLTLDQERALDARARAAGLSRSALVRRIIDRALAPTNPPDPPVDARSLSRLASAYHGATEGMFDADPDLHIER